MFLLLPLWLVILIPCGPNRIQKAVNWPRILALMYINQIADPVLPCLVFFRNVKLACWSYLSADKKGVSMLETKNENLSIPGREEPAEELLSHQRGIRYCLLSEVWWGAVLAFRSLFVTWFESLLLFSFIHHGFYNAYTSTVNKYYYLGSFS